MNKKHFIKLPTANGQIFIKPEEIIWVSSYGRTVDVFLDNGSKKEVYLGLGKIEELLEFEYFYQCHRCHIINLLQVREIINGHPLYLLITRKYQLHVTGKRVLSMLWILLVKNRNSKLLITSC